MSQIEMNKHSNRDKSCFEKKILLAILPYWDPLIPPSGIATLKGYLKENGFNHVKTVDVIVLKEFQDLYGEYFLTLEEYIPIDNRGNFYNMGHNVLQDHMMAHIHHQDEEEYVEFIKALIYSVFYFPVDTLEIVRLNNIIKNIFIKLESYFTHLLEEEQPDVLGLSAYIGTLPASMFVFRLTKQMYPHILTVMGGSVFSTTLTEDSPNFKMIMEKTRDYIDKVIIGEGEILLAKLLRGELPGSQRIFSLKRMDMKGLDLADAALPDYSDFDVGIYPYIAATGSTSCPNTCSFCNSKVYWGKYRKKNVKQTADEMIMLFKRYGNQLFYMSDAIINPIISDLSREFMERDISLYFDAFHRVDDPSCDIENTLLWRRGGLYRVRLGVESGSPKVLHLMGKDITIDQIRGTLYALAYAGIKTTTYWVIGHPGETEEDFQQTLDLLEELKNVIYQAEPTPLEFVYSGQVASRKWEKYRKMALPEKTSKKLLISYNWIVDTDPKRDVVIERICRFDQLARKLGIPNPYSLKEHFAADERWHKLHKNAVPPLLKFFNREYVDENKNINLALPVENAGEFMGDFSFQI